MADARSRQHESLDAFVIMILSDGCGDHILGVDGGLLNFHRDIVRQYDTHHCPALSGKPKIFITLTCHRETGNLECPRS